MALTLALAMVGAQAALAASSSTILLFAPGAPQGAPVSVEWLDRSINLWIPVTGWIGTLYQKTDSGVPFQQFAVLPDNYGQGPFRWVVYKQASNMPAASNTTTGNTSTASTTAVANNVWGSSSPFMLPNTDGITLDITVFPAQTLQVTNPVVTNPVVTTKNNKGTPAVTNPIVPGASSTFMMALNCPTGGCNASAITGKFTGLPASSWITVEWLDSKGVWQPVMGWQGQADFIDASGNLVKQFGVYQQNYGQGPFRWAVYNAPTGGSLLAISPNFNLPSADGVNEVLNLAG